MGGEGGGRTKVPRSVPVINDSGCLEGFCEFLFMSFVFVILVICAWARENERERERERERRERGVSYHLCLGQSLGETVVGIFAVRDIKKGDEITIDYQVCVCGGGVGG